MIYSITVKNYLDEKLKLTLREPEKTGFLVVSATGLGPVKANINTTEVVTDDGTMYNSARLEQRNIVLQLIFVDSDAGESIEELRQKTYKYFPIKKQVELTVETDNRIVKTTGYVESNEPNIFSTRQGTQISIVCPDPYFYSAENGGNITDFSSIKSAFEFPFSNESFSENLIEFGDIQINSWGSIVYEGDAEVGVTIRIHANGSANNISVYNANTKEAMTISSDKIQSLTGSGIVTSDDIVINTSKGNKTITLIRGGVSYNILNALGKNTTWFTLAKGDNLFAFTAESGLTNLQIKIANDIVYEGI